MRKLRPIRFKDEYYKGVERDINEYFKETIYKPINDIIEGYVSGYYDNAKPDPLREALLKGRVQYVSGKFYGYFNSRISRRIKEIGGKWSKTTNTWNINQAALPMDVQVSVATSISRFTNMHSDVQSFLTTTNFLEASTGASILKTFENLEKDFRKTAKGIEILPKLTEDSLIRLSQEYNKSINTFIKKWTDENVLKLRDMVSANAQQGFRASNLEKIIQDNFGVSKRKAKFLAEQETSLFVSKYKELRYKQIGITKYQWSTSRDERVRQDHKLLDGNIFSFNNPPIVDRKTGRTANPGEDFGCRCNAIPIIE